MNKSKYVMHALIADLARSVSQEICFNLDDSWKGGFIHEHTKLGSAKIRHSAFSCHRYDISKRFEVYNEMKSLRTFLALPISSSPENYFYHLSGKVLTELVHKLRRLRVLSLAGYSLVDLPSSICALKHLRYLNLSYTAITRLPKSLSELFNLQTLNLHGCSELVELPSDIGNLINLHYLDISDTNSLQEMPLQISKLTYLRLLPKFIVGQGNGLGIKELMKLPHLQGQLWIIGLQNVVNVRDAELSGLHEKLGLDELALEWIDNFQVSRNGGE
ncbi:DISEASE RESISTANCE PROTEIN RP [Salix viminalis]|uniref:DISEASE RESISTANCE PROTEIN RP n=1 Tax=Salix viminalis TaxID=40686 RepID=A0A9Q0QKF9_SALVM|nr:DISEASE RESISTANCE PROTEIN RP [Salix viminalis]